MLPPDPRRSIIHPKPDVGHYSERQKLSFSIGKRLN
jgi:hypothetical protein